MLLLRNRGIPSRVQVMGFSLSVCHVRQVVEIVDSYPCDHCYDCLIISIIKHKLLILYRLDWFGLLRNRFIKNAFERFDKPFRNFT